MDYLIPIGSDDGTKEEVWNMLLEAYECLCYQISNAEETGDGHSLPFVGELFEMTLENLYFTEKESLIEQSILNQEHLRLGYENVEQYRIDAWRGTIKADWLTPDYFGAEIEDIVQQLLVECNLFFLDYSFQMQNCPIVEVW